MKPLSSIRKLRPLVSAAVQCFGFGDQAGLSDYDQGYRRALQDVLSLIETGKPRNGLWFCARMVARSLKCMQAERGRKSRAA